MSILCTTFVKCYHVHSLRYSCGQFNKNRLIDFNVRFSSLGTPTLITRLEADQKIKKPTTTPKTNDVQVKNIEHSILKTVINTDSRGEKEMNSEIIYDRGMVVV